jgi:hypothetical protein
MTKKLLVGAAALALLSGAAVAQTTFETSRTTTTTVAPVAPIPAPVVDSYSTTKTERSYTPTGAAVETQQTYKSGLNGSASSSESKVVRPDGSSEVTTRKEWSNAPAAVVNPVVPPTSTTTTTVYQR